MTILQRLTPSREAENAAACAEFHKLARCLLSADSGHAREALEVAQATRARPRVVDILKSAVQPATISDWSSIADYVNISAAFSTSLRGATAFDRMLPDMVPAPLRSRGITVTTGIVGSTVPERSVKPVSKISFGNALIEPKKAAAIVIVTREVAKSLDANTNALIDRELTAAVAQATDVQFVGDLIGSTTPAASAGSTLANAVADISTLLGAVGTGANSKLFYLASPTNMKRLALKSSSTGAPAFPGLGPTGGELMPGVTAIAVDALGTPGFSLMVDATGLAGSADIIRLDASEQGTLQLETAPDSPPTASTTLLALWQANLRALRCERFFGYVVLRADAVASISGTNY